MSRICVRGENLGREKHVLIDFDDGIFVYVFAARQVGEGTNIGA